MQNNSNLKNLDLDHCIRSLRTVSRRPNKFAELKKRYSNRYILYFVIDIGTIENCIAGFDNHHNHQRPHFHVKIGKKSVSVSIDNGEILAGELTNSMKRVIREWVSLKRDCLKFMYNNIQLIRNAEEFSPLIRAINKYL